MAVTTSQRALSIFAGALALRGIYYLSISRTACLDINLDPVSDMEAFHRWALSIVSGDWLGRTGFHPFHPWQTAVASPEQWSAWYGDVFHQEPLYPYLVALLYLVAPRVPASVILFQMMLGAAGCALIYMAGRRLMSEGAALAAGVLSVFYGPCMYYESLLLRDSILIPINALILWLALEARARAGSTGGWSWWGALGLAIGVSYIAKAVVLPFLVLWVVVSLIPARGGAAWHRRAGSVAVMVAGFVLAFSSVAARNLAVGAPLLMTTTRGPVELINGNNPWHPGIGWFDGDDSRVSQYARDLLARSDGRLIPTAVAILETWSDDLGGLAWLQIVKTGYFFAPFEMPNNASYSYFRLNSPVLAWSALSFFWVSPLALVGLVESRRRWRDWLAVHLFLASGVALTILFYVIARFRAPLMPAILLLAGLGLWSMATLALGRDWRRLAMLGAMAGAALLANVWSHYPDEMLVRPRDYMISIAGYQARGRTESALSEAEGGRAAFPAMPHFHKAAGAIYASLGRSSEALAAYKEALARDPADQEARREIFRLEPLKAR